MIPQGEVLDLACGGGRHSVLLASMGYDVIALDRDADSLSRLAAKRITTMQFDLENGTDGRMPVWPFEANRFSGIVVTNYLHRPLLPHIVTSLTSKGLLIYETFAQGNEYFGKPSNPDFLLATGELLIFAALNSLRVIAFEDGFVESPKPAMVQRICAVKAGSGLSIGSLRVI
ncbi:MAG TPA: class I SAM-dependent methyltransferase [Burkholderiaceae bacterium]